MTPKRIFWILCLGVIVFFFLFLYPKKEAPKLKQAEQTEAVGTVEDASISETLLAKTVKLVIRQAINYTDTEKMKETAIKKIKRKSDEKYSRELNKIFNDIEYMGVEDTFGITRDSSRADVVKFIEDLDKEVMLKKLDEVPDQAIARLIKKKFEEKRMHSITQLKDYLNKRIYKIMKPTSVE